MTSRNWEEGVSHFCDTIFEGSSKQVKGVRKSSNLRDVINEQTLT